jgi:flavodoxin
MSTTKALVVYYSLSGHAREAAREIARRLGGELEEITDPRKRTGFFGFMRSGMESSFNMCPAIHDPTKDPGDYQLIVVGAPVWAGKMASPIRAYLSRHGDRLPQKTAFFSTSGGRGMEKVPLAMAALCNRKPLAIMALADGEQGSARNEKIERFIKTLTTA